MPHNPSQDELRRQLAALEQQAETVRQQLIGRGVQVAGNQTVAGDVVLRDKIGVQINLAADAPPEDLLAA